MASARRRLLPLVPYPLDLAARHLLAAASNVLIDGGLSDELSQVRRCGHARTCVRSGPLRDQFPQPAKRSAGTFSEPRCPGFRCLHLGRGLLYQRQRRDAREGRRRQVYDFTRSFSISASAEVFYFSGARTIW